MILTVFSTTTIIRNGTVGNKHNHSKNRIKNIQTFLSDPVAKRKRVILHASVGDLLDLGEVAFPSGRDVLLGLEHGLQVENDRLFEVLGLPDVEELDLFFDQPGDPVEVFLRKILRKINALTSTSTLLSRSGLIL